MTDADASASRCDAAEPGPVAGGPSARLLVWTAVGVVVLFHGALLAVGSYEGTYDALIHVFFGAHYARDWFDPWEPRWYTGFLTVAYPPLAHQLIAALSHLVGLKAAFATVQLAALVLLTVGVYRFTAAIAGQRAAGYAALSLAVSSSIVETVHIFGQLPTTLSLAFLMNALPFIWRYVRAGGVLAFVRSVAWMAATTASHHVTTLFGGVFFVGPLVAIALFEAVRIERPGEAVGTTLAARVRRRAYRVSPTLVRTALFGVAAVAGLVLVVLPYWVWSRVDPILQVPIPHGSRENFLLEPSLGLFFWAIPWASSVAFLPYVVVRGLRSWRWPLATSVLFLTLLGTGGTTPLPRLLLRGAYDILTLDRFTFWASMLILPFVGLAIESLLHGRIARALRTWGRSGRSLRRLALGSIVVGHVGVAVAVVAVPAIQPIQPAAIDIDPIVRFLEKDEHWRYRYLTLGFGDQMAWLAANTRATTPDGNYHSARRLPELTTVAVERLEGAKYMGVPGVGSLEQFLETPERYHLKFVLSNDAFYDPLLYFHGWHSLGVLENGIEVWERDDVPPLPERLPRRVWPVSQRLMWGLLPPAAALAALLAWWVPALARRGRRAGREQVMPRSSPAPSIGAVRGWVVAGIVFDLLLVVGIAAAWSLHQRGPGGPEGAVVHYWDRIDYKDLEGAWRWVQPVDGLDFERWVLDRSVVGGLLSGYAKLEGVTTEVIAEGEADAATVVATLTWFTSLGELEERVVHHAVRGPGGWRLRVGPRDSLRPPVRFVVQPELDVYRAPRRLTTAATHAGDVLDRPELEVLEARLIAYLVPGEVAREEAPPLAAIAPISASDDVGLRLAIVGVVRNADPRPADVTLTGVLRNAQGARVAATNAGSTMLHTLLPGETTPFRIDFDGVDGPHDPEVVVGADLVAKAVVTSYGLERPIATWSRPTGSSLAVRLVNVGSDEATIPQVLLSLYAGDRLAWVTEAYLSASLVPFASAELRMPSTLPPGFRVVSDVNVASEARSIYGTDVLDAPMAVPRFPLAPVASALDEQTEDVERGGPLAWVPTAYVVQGQAFRSTR